ncbi:MAG: hypothetical protein HYZ75_15355 [Elusimicrobia bacterium]|nr:hypothetical protein [Elusimicrobiota bacterium]
MNRLITFVAALAFTASASFAAAPTPAPALTLTSFTGQIQIKLADGTIQGVVPGASAISIPAGAQVTIISGEAVMTGADGVVVSANAGDSFSFNSVNGQTQIAATGTGEITVTIGTTEATLGAGDTIGVTAGADGKAEIKAITGEIAVTSGGQTTTLAQGQSSSTTSTTSTTDSTATTDSGETTEGGDNLTNYNSDTNTAVNNPAQTQAVSNSTP